MEVGSGGLMGGGGGEEDRVRNHKKFIIIYFQNVLHDGRAVSSTKRSTGL